MEKRTEEQKITQEPVEVVFGSARYQITPLVIKESREWRKKVIEMLKTLPEQTKVTSDDKEKFEAALENLLVTMPDTVVDLFFAYARNLNRDEIESIATDRELAVAWQKVVELAFPLLQTVVQTMSKMAP